MDNNPYKAPQATDGRLLTKRLSRYPAWFNAVVSITSISVVLVGVELLRQSIVQYIFPKRDWLFVVQSILVIAAGIGLPFVARRAIRLRLERKK